MKRFVVIAVLVAAAGVVAGPQAGRAVYVSGSGTASVAGGEAMPAALFPCANCHGADGRGNAEGGVVASNITWHELTKPYRASTPNGRKRPAYTEQTLRRAITEGVDSAGNPLHAAMPRYAMSPEALSGLVGYLKILGGDAVPGVSETTVRVGTIVPASEAGAQMAAVLAAYFEEAGEIHGRRIELQTVTSAQLTNAPPFALVGGLTDAKVEEAVERAGIPLVLPVSVRRSASANNQQRFYLHPAIDAQFEGLLQFTGTTRESAILFTDPDARLAGTPVGDTQLLLFAGTLLPSDFFDEAPKYGSRIRVALTTTPGDLTGIAEYRAFAARHSIPPTQVASQLSAYAAAQAFVQALKQGGRALTRDALRASLEGFYEFHTGVTPPLTFGRGRRVGATRVQVATMDSGGNLVPAGTFQTSE